MPEEAAVRLHDISWESVEGAPTVVVIDGATCGTRTFQFALEAADRTPCSAR